MHCMFFSGRISHLIQSSLTRLIPTLLLGRQIDDDDGVCDGEGDLSGLWGVLLVIAMIRQERKGKKEKGMSWMNCGNHRWKKREEQLRPRDYDACPTLKMATETKHAEKCEVHHAKEKILSEIIDEILLPPPVNANPLALRAFRFFFLLPSKGI